MLNWSIYVESAFQLKNAFDFLNHRKASGCKYIIRLNGVKKNDDEMLRFAKAKCINFKVVILPKRGPLKAFWGLYALLYIYVLFVSSRNVVVGDQRSIVFRLTVPLLRCPLYIVDDGAYSFSAMQELDFFNDNKITWITRFNILAKRSKNVIYFPFDKKSVKFSCYALIVGAPLSECEVLSREDHQKCIEILVYTLREKGFSNIFYFPHREERFLLIDKEVSIIRSESSIEDFLESRVDGFPKLIVSFYSTAIFLLLEKFREVEIGYFDITSFDSFDCKRFSSVVHVYEALKEQEAFCKNAGSAGILERL